MQLFLLVGIWLGYHLRDNWEKIREYTEVIDIVLVVLILAAIAFFIYKQVQSMRRA